MARKKAHKSRRSSGRKMPLKLLEDRATRLLNKVLARGGHVPAYKVSRKAKHRRGR